MHPDPWRVLVVDDEMVIRRLVGAMLGRARFEVLYAEDGEAAWRVLQEQAIDLVITDCSMPVLNGLELLRRIRATPACAVLPVIMMTGTGLDDMAQQAEREGANEFLSKVLSPDVLLAAVERALR
jgi:CheY-like chemotaxis protein